MRVVEEIFKKGNFYYYNSLAKLNKLYLFLLNIDKSLSNNTGRHKGT